MTMTSSRKPVYRVPEPHAMVVAPQPEAVAAGADATFACLDWLFELHAVIDTPANKLTKTNADFFIKFRIRGLVKNLTLTFMLTNWYIVS